MKEVGIRLKVGADGLENLKALSNELKQAGVDTSAFDTKAAELSAELRRLGAEQSLIDNFKRQKGVVKEAADAFDQAQQKAQQLGRELAATDGPTKAQAKAFASARDAVNATQKAYQASVGTLQEMRPRLEAAGISTDQLAAAQVRVHQQTDAARTALAAARTEVTALAAESQRTAAAGERMAAAWSTLGVRSFKDVQVEAAKVRTALQQIQQTSRNPAEIKIATEAAQQKLKALEGELGAVQVAAQSSSAGMSAGFTGVAAKIGGVIGGVEALKKVLEVGLAQQKLQAQLTSIFEEGSRVAGALGFVGQTAQDLGLRLDVAGSSFAKLAASAKGTSLEGQKTRDIFTGVAQASAALKLSSEETEGTLLAVSQIMSKGTVQAEELRGQLGERLPGAFQIAARAMGLTTAELGKFLETGNLAADDFLPKFAAELSKTFGPGAQQAAKGLDAEFNRLVNTLSTFYKEIANSGLFDTVTKQVHNLAVALQQGLDSGELQVQAEKIGQSLAHIVEFLGNAALWALKFGDALLFVAKVLTEGALLIGIGKLLTGLGAVRLASAEAATGIAAVGTASVASSAGIAAAGTSAATSAARMGLLGTALRLLPAGIAIALAVEGLPAAGKAIGEFAARLTGVDRDLAAAHERRVKELDGEIAALAEGQAAQAKYANLTLLGRKQLLQQSPEVRAAYTQELEGALAAAGAAAQYTAKQKERAAEEKEIARLRGAGTKELAAYGEAERKYGEQAQAAADRQAELRKELVAVQAAAKDLATGLSPAAIELKEKFDGFVKSGKDAAEVIKEIAKAADLGSVKGIQAFGQALRKLGEEGKLTPQQIEAAWKDAIDKLTGEDLQKFTTQAKAAFGESGRDAQAMGDAIGQAVRQAFKGAGLDFEQFRGGISTGTRAAVADLDVIAASAEKAGISAKRVGDALREALTKDIGAAKTTQDLDLLSTSIDGYAAKNLLAADKTRELKAEIEAARLGLGPLGDAAKKAGVDIGELTTGVSSGFKKSVADVDELARQIDKAGISAQRAAPILAAALDQRVAAARTKEELALVRAEIEKMGASGTLTGQQVTRMLGDIKAKAEQLDPVLQQAQRDAALLGVTLRDNVGQGASAGVETAIAAFERLKSGGKASASEIDLAFVNMANKVIKANGGIVPEWVKVEAATRGATIAVDEFGNATVSAATKAGAALNSLGERLNQLAGSLGSAYDAALKLRNAADFSKLGENKYDKDNFALGADGNRLNLQGQIKVPEGYVFDNDAFQRDQVNAARNPNGVAPDPAKYYKAPSGSLLGGPVGFIGGSGFVGGATGSAAPSTTSTTSTVNIVINGRSTPVSVASPADATTLQQLLQQLALDANRASP